MAFAAESTLGDSTPNRHRAPTIDGGKRGTRPVIVGWNIRPGTRRRGVFRVTAHGNGRLSLHILRMRDQAGVASTGQLSRHLRVRVKHGSHTLYDGPVRRLPAIDLGYARDGAVRTYRLNFLFANGARPAADGRGDNAVQGAGARIVLAVSQAETR